MRAQYLPRISLFLLTLLFPAYSAAEEIGPSKVLEKLVAELKKSGEPAVIVDYVHWPTAWKALKPEEKAMTKSNSPAELKEYFRKFLSDPKKVLRGQIEGHLVGLDGGDQGAMEERISSIIAQVEEQFTQGSEVLVNSEYQVGKEVIDGYKAHVELKSSYQGQSKLESIDFIKIEDHWLLPKMDKLGNSPVR